MRVKKESIERLLSDISIIEVISNYTDLKKSGKNYSGLCPLHQENTPSFYVDPEKNLFHCFGCKKGGNLIQFIQERENLNFIEALEFLSDRFNIDLEYEGGNSGNTKYKELFSTMKEVVEVYKTNLWTNKKVQNFIKQRRLSKNILQEFSLGYSNGNLLNHSSINKENLFKLGIIQTKKNTFESFKERLIFPIFDKFSRCVALGGRILEGDRFKYLNSINNDIYDKSKILYGLNIAKKYIKEKDFSIVCEGFIDCLRLHEAGFKNSVASLGTKLSYYQIKELKKISNNIFLMYDGDKAGMEASKEVCQKAASMDVNLRIVNLGQGQDPDDFILNNSMANILQKLKKSSFFVDYYLEDFLKKTEDIYIKSKNLEECKIFLEKIKNEYIKKQYKKKLEDFFDIDIKLEKKNENITKDNNKNETDAENKNSKGQISRFIEELLTLALNYEDVLEIIFKKYYKNIDDSNFKNIILNLHLGKTPDKILCLDLPEEYKKLLLQIEFVPGKKKVLDDPEAQVVHIFENIHREKLLAEIKYYEKKMKEPGEISIIQKYQRKYIELIREYQKSGKESD